MQEIDEVMTQIPEIQTYSYTVENNTITLLIELFNKNERKRRKLRNSFAIETEVTKLLSPLTSQ
jgi:hypothetical protein